MQHQDTTASLASQQPEIIAALQKLWEKKLWHPQQHYALDVELQLTQLVVLNAVHIAKHASVAKKSAILLRRATVKVPDTTLTLWQCRL